MNITDTQLSSTGELVEFLLNAEIMTSFEFYELTDILVSMWADAHSPLRKSWVDFIIIAAINQRDWKWLTRQQYLDIVYLLVPLKVKTASKEVLEEYPNLDGLLKYI